MKTIREISILVGASIIAALAVNYFSPAGIALVGQWNTARIRKSGDRIEHWLNGEKVVDITRGSPAWQRAIADSKFADVVGFGAASSGHVTLQDHGDVVWYRNIKVRAIGRAEGRRHDTQ